MRRRALVGLALVGWLGLAGVTAGQQVTVGKDCVITWTAPTKNADGTALTDLKEYRLYARTGTSYPATPNQVLPKGTITTSCKAAKITTGSPWIIVRAVDQVGNEAKNSNEVQIFVDANPPANATSLKTTVTKTDTTTTTTIVTPR